MWPFKKKKKRRKATDAVKASVADPLPGPGFFVNDADPGNPSTRVLATHADIDLIKSQLNELSVAVDTLTKSMEVVLPAAARLQQLFAHQEELLRKNNS